MGRTSPPSLPAPRPRVLTSIPDMEEPTPLQQHPDTPKIPAEPLPPIQSRFLFVDVAALRAKQLRRGARPRLGDEVQVPHKAERVAMEEVKRGLVTTTCRRPRRREKRPQDETTNSDCARRPPRGRLQHGVRAVPVHRLLCRLRVHEDEADRGRPCVGGQEPRRADQPSAVRLFRARRPRGPADQLKSPELLEAAARK